MAFKQQIPNACKKLKLRNKKATFDENGHKYKLNGVSVLSVSSIISKYKPEFPTEQVLPKMVTKYGQTKEDWRNLFELKKQRNTFMGSSLHAFANSEFIRPGYLEPITEQEIALLKAIDFLESKGWVIVAAETFNVSEKYMIGYTFDILLYNTIDKIFALGDYKQNEFYTAIQYKNKKGYNPKGMLPPFDKYDFRDVTEYSISIQLGLYGELLKEESGIVIDKFIGIHISPSHYTNGYKIYDVTKRVDRIKPEFEQLLNLNKKSTIASTILNEELSKLYDDL